MVRSTVIGWTLPARATSRPLPVTFRRVAVRFELPLMKFVRRGDWLRQSSKVTSQTGKASGLTSGWDGRGGILPSSQAAEKPLRDQGT